MTVSAIYDPPNLTYPGPGWLCSCGQWVLQGVLHICQPPVATHTLTAPVGWQCPCCGTCWSPTVMSCMNTHDDPPTLATSTNEDGGTP